MREINPGAKVKFFVLTSNDDMGLSTECFSNAKDLQAAICGVVQKSDEDLASRMLSVEFESQDWDDLWQEFDNEHRSFLDSYTWEEQFLNIDELEIIDKES